MDYTMEELIPIVGELAEKYTAKESTSITYEKAEQLMGAVLYAIHETELSDMEGGDDAVTGTARDKSENANGTVLVQKKGMTARQAYEGGMALVEKKVRKTLAMYNEMMPEFSDYGNICLYDTVVREIGRAHV